VQQEPAAEARLEELRRRAGPAGFAPGFPDRVMARLGRAPSLADGMQAVLLRLAPLAAAAALVLAAANVAGSHGNDLPFLDRVLNLRPVELASPYALQLQLDAAADTP
jgi:hypothetical protein